MQTVKHFPLSAAAARRMQSWRRGDGRGRWLGAANPPPPIGPAKGDPSAADDAGKRPAPFPSVAERGVPSSHQERRLAWVLSSIDAVTHRKAPDPRPSTIDRWLGRADFLAAAIAYADDEDGD